jgi:multimeric flavodoxin WrbA
MKVLGLVGSPRKGGNTDLVIDAILASAESNGNEVDKLYLGDSEIGPCVDCRACKKSPFECVLNDGMRGLYPRLNEADALVFGTPIFWFGPTGPMKTLLDRLRPYVANHNLQGKRALLAIQAGDGPGDADLTVEMFRRSLEYLEVELTGYVLGTAYDRGDILADTEAMAKAAALGAAL